MATIPQTFDPYHRWLGIRDPQRPPHHYRLLGLEPFENDEDVIREAATRHLNHVKSFRIGPHKEVAQQVLDEITAARDLLLDEGQRVLYDRMLRTQLAESNESTPEMPAVSSGEPRACSQCGRENGPSRKFCGECGSSLTDHCIECNAVVGADEKHCGHCGIELEATTAQRRAAAAAKLKDADRLRRLYDFDESLRLLAELTNQTHSRLAEYRQQAQQRIGEIEQQRKTLLAQSEQAEAEARELAAAHDFEQAAARLEATPERLRSEDAKALLADARAKQIELMTLSAQIRQGVETKQFEGLLAKVERVLAIKPNSTKMQALQEQLLALEQKRLERQRDQLCKAALEALKSHDYERGLALLERVPESARSEQVLKLQEAARAKSAECAWLLQDLNEAVAVDRELYALAARYAELKPNDSQARLYVERLANLKAPGESRWPAPPAESPWHFPVQSLAAPRQIDCSKLAAAKEGANWSTHAVAFGLALQGLGRGPATTNLLPAQRGGVMSLFKMATRRRGSQAAWGIDIGRACVRAVKLVAGPEPLAATAEAAVTIPHERVINRGDADATRVIQDSLRKLLEQCAISDPVVASVPASRVLARFPQLPTIESKKIANLMKFEVRQQIPFPVEETHFDWQLLEQPGTPVDLPRSPEVGLLVVKLDEQQSYCRMLEEAGLRVETIQCDAMALYNYASVEQLAVPRVSSGGLSERIALLDVGSETSTLLITDGARCWFRTMNVGGGAFTRAAAKALGVDLLQAEDLKCKQQSGRALTRVLEAMDPAMHEFVAELRRSLEYFRSTGQPVRVTKLIALGGGMRLHGMQRRLWHGAT